MTRARRHLLGALALGLATLGAADLALARDASASAVRRALRYLARQQVEAPIDIRSNETRLRDYPGDWPQYFRLRGTTFPRIRDVSPFTVSFIHHALTHVTEETRGGLGLSRRDVAEARTMRVRAVDFLRRFESSENALDAGAFGFWPYDEDPRVPGPALSRALVQWIGGPILGGERVPLNLRIFPSELAIPTDADVTATTYAALLDDARLDGGPGTDAAFEQLLADWRDLGQVPRRLNPPWLPPASGAFLTWLNYREPGTPDFPNDVDLVVNANVLYALGRHGKLDTPGVDDAAGLIDLAVALGLHRGRFTEIAEYYPDNLVFQYSVSRAFREGGVAGLGPAVRALADELEATAIEPGDGTAYWNRGAPQLNTAFALLTLLNAGRDTPLIDGAVAYLVREQRFSGGFDEATFFIARGDNGPVFEFFSTSFTTAMALEALARALLAPPGGHDGE